MKGERGDTTQPNRQKMSTRHKKAQQNTIIRMQQNKDQPQINTVFA